MVLKFNPIFRHKKVEALLKKKSLVISVMSETLNQYLSPKKKQLLKDNYEFLKRGQLYDSVRYPKIKKFSPLKEYERYKKKLSKQQNEKVNKTKK